MATNFSNIAFVLPLILALNGCATFFSDFVNYGFSDPNLKATFEFFGGTEVEAEVQALTDEPPIVLGNGISESGKVMIPDGPFNIPIGNPFVIGELEGQSELSLTLGMRISELSGILGSTGSHVVPVGVELM